MGLILILVGLVLHSVYPSSGTIIIQFTVSCIFPEVRKLHIKFTYLIGVPYWQNLVETFASSTFRDGWLEDSSTDSSPGARYSSPYSSTAKPYLDSYSSTTGRYSYLDSIWDFLYSDSTRTRQRLYSFHLWILPSNLTFETIFVQQYFITAVFALSHWQQHHVLRSCTDIDIWTWQPSSRVCHCIRKALLII
jgi:hypothetical protein